MLDIRYSRTFIAVLLAAALTGVCAAEPVITEFMASNSEALADGDGNFPDWIELHNPDPSPAMLEGWGLRDSQNTWLFPADATIPPGGYLIVFASGQLVDNYVDAGGYLHTTFKLSASGEPLALLRPDGSTAMAYDPVPSQREDVAYGIVAQFETLVQPDSMARHWVPNSSLTGEWIQAGYDDVMWTIGKAAVGYNTAPGPVLAGTSGMHTAYRVESGAVGHQNYGGALGMDFEVNEEVLVTDLGVFDSGSDGLTRTITAQLWRRSGDSGVSVLADETFTPASPGALEGGSRFKPLAFALVLAPGSYTMVAHGYGSGEPIINQGSSPSDSLNIDTGGGVLQFVGGGRYGNAGSFPGTIDGGPANRYAAGTFKFGLEAANDVETDVEAAMRGSNSSILLRVPFDVSDPAEIKTLSLDVGFDDGFIAWINGVEVAGRNAPDELSWDASATAEGNEKLSLPVVLPAGVLGTTGNILAIHGLNRSAGDGDFIIRPALSGISHDFSSPRYFTNPTPARPNDPSGIIEFVADTKFSMDRGFYDAPFEVAITSATPDAMIRYTTDGSTPTETHGTIYTGPVLISDTTVLRAAAFRDDFGPTNVDTHSYLFLESVAVQGSPAGYPETWRGVTADYAMDPDPGDYARAAGDAGFTPEQARAAIVESLKAIPTISIVTDQHHLFDPATGIYLNPSGRGVQWERPVSVEIIEEGTGRYQTNAGLRIMGFTSRNLNVTPKLNMRLLFKKQYGDATMAYPILGAKGPDAFNTIALRGNNRDAWVGNSGAFYIGDEWAKRAQYDMGQPAVRGIFAHVYINGIYWGFYNPTERPDDAFAETYLGGDKTEYDVVKFCCPDRATAGSTAVWDSLLSEASAGLSTEAAYQRIQGNNPDGSANLSYPVLMDVDNFIDYLINGHYHAQGDWPGNYYVIRDQLEWRTEGFKFLTWDNDMPFGGGNPNSGNKVNTSPGSGWWTDSPGEIDIAIRLNPEYRVRFADRVYKHYHHGGAMTVASNLARWTEMADHVRPALFAESARWGDAKGAALRTVQDNWDPKNLAMVNSYFPNRQQVVFNQIRAHNLYPDLAAPEFSQHGGIIEEGFELTLTTEEGTIYYTLDGSDPRFPGGGISPDALIAGQGSSNTLIPSGADVRVLVPADGTLGTDWTDPDFNDQDWIAGQTGVGYERTSGYEDHIETDLEAVMYGENASVYMRIGFNVSSPEDIQQLKLRMKYDDGFVAYLNGQLVESANAPVDPAWNASATTSHGDGDAVIFQQFDLTAHTGLIRAGTNVLAIHGLNSTLSSTDLLILPELVSTEPGLNSRVSITETMTVVKARSHGSEWSPLNEALFYFDIPLRITELNYHPRDPEAGSPYVADDFEFMELQNVGDHNINLDGMGISGGVTYDFPVYILNPGEVVVIASNIQAFLTRYGLEGINLIGEYSGKLGNAGDYLFLEGLKGEPILDIDYADTWYPFTDGQGASLGIRDSLLPPEAWQQQENWFAIEVMDGTPGSVDGWEPPTGGWQRVGDMNQDGVVDLSDAIRSLIFLFGETPVALPCETALDSPGNMALLDLNVDGGFDLSDPVYLLRYLFSDGPDPVNGTDCRRVEGCPSVCR